MVNVDSPTIVVVVKEDSELTIGLNSKVRIVVDVVPTQIMIQWLCRMGIMVNVAPAPVVAQDPGPSTSRSSSPALELDMDLEDENATCEGDLITAAMVD